MRKIWLKNASHLAVACSIMPTQTQARCKSLVSKLTDVPPVFDPCTVSYHNATAHKEQYRIGKKHYESSGISACLNFRILLLARMTTI